jgi:hypothetical protein
MLDTSTVPFAAASIVRFNSSADAPVARNAAAINTFSLFISLLSFAARPFAGAL